MAAHRMSDGCLELSSMNTGHNTWPHRASLPGNTLVTSYGYPDFTPYSGSQTLPRKLNHDCSLIAGQQSNTTYPIGGVSEAGGISYHWGGYQVDSKYSNKPWPLNSAGTSLQGYVYFLSLEKKPLGI